MKKLISIVIIFSTAVAFLAEASGGVSTRYVTLQQRLEGKELTAAEANGLLKTVKRPLVKTGSQDKSFFASCNQQENSYLSIERKVLAPFFDAVKKGDLETAGKFAEEGLQVKGDLFAGKTTKEGLELYRWETSSSSLAQFFKRYESIDDISFETVLVRVEPLNTKNPANFSKALLKVDLDLRGKTSGDQRLQSQGFLLIQVGLQGANWKIQSIQVGDGQSVVTSAKPRFLRADNDKVFGTQLNRHIRSEAIRRGGYGLSVNDYNGDEKPDIYVGGVLDSQTFVNKGDGTFALDKKVPSDHLVKSVAFADFDNDGLQDLLVVRFVADNEKSRLVGETAITVYRNKGDGRFEKLANVIEELPERQDRAMPAALGDFDNDGLLDFYVGYPGVMDFTHPVVKKNLQSHGLYFGNKKGAFSPLSAENYKRSFAQNLQGFPHSALAVDYNNDNLTDILVVDDRAGLSSAFTNRGGRTFEQQAEQIGFGNNGYGMQVAAADINGDGILDLVLTNVETAASERISKSCYENNDIQWATFHERPLRVFLGTTSTGFQEADPEKWGLGHTGYGLSGLRFFDYDNDGKVDLYVTNGLWSGTDRNQKFDSYFVRSHSYESVNGIQASLERSMKNRPQSVYMDILSFFKGDIFGDNKDQNSRPSLAGFQRNRLYKNVGDRFVDVAYLEGVDSISDGYMAAAADLNGDGQADLILRNADPGSKDASFEPVEVFMNSERNSNRSLNLRLQGKGSNFDGIGAKVFVTVGGKTQMQPLIGLDGTIQSSKVLHFGIGNNRKVDRLRILWPSGKETKINGLAAGFHVIKEEN